MLRREDGHLLSGALYVEGEVVGEGGDEKVMDEAG